MVENCHDVQGSGVKAYMLDKSRTYVFCDRRNRGTQDRDTARDLYRASKDGSQYLCARHAITCWEIINLARIMSYEGSIVYCMSVRESR
jgi:hypothetical protein